MNFVLARKINWIFNIYIFYLWSKFQQAHHYVKSVRIRSHSGPYFPEFRLNTNQNNFEYGQFYTVHVRRKFLNFNESNAFPYKHVPYKSMYYSRKLIFLCSGKLDRCKYPGNLMQLNSIAKIHENYEQTMHLRSLAFL